MEKTEKGTAKQHDFRAHCFPDLSGAAADDAGPDTATCSQFQPLYPEGQSQGGYRPANMAPSGTGRESPGDASQKRQNAYDSGVKAGQQDARCLLQEEIAPGLLVFKQSVSAFNQRLEEISLAASRNVTRLAQEIVRKILGQTPELPEQDHTALEQTILDVLHRTYALHMKMNSDDLAHLTAMLECDPSFTYNPDTFRLSADNETQRDGRDRTEPPEEMDVAPIDRMLTQILDALPQSQPE